MSFALEIIRFQFFHNPWSNKRDIPVLNVTKFHGLMNYTLFFVCLLFHIELNNLVHSKKKLGTILNPMNTQ